MSSRKSVADIINEREAKRAQGDWRPASGGTEKPFTTRTGRRLLYVHQPSTGQSAYMDMDTDIVLSQRDAEFALGLGDAGWDNYPNLYTHSILIKTKQYNTDTGSARVKAWVTRGGSTKTNSIPYPYEMNTTERHMAAAVALVKKFGWDGRFDPNGPRHASTPGTLVHVFVHGYP